MSSDENVRAWIDAGRAAWPGIDVPDAALSAHFARHAPADGTLPNAADLYLACACLAGHPKALAELEARCLAGVGKGIWQVATADRDDVVQRTRELLLLGTNGAEPLLARYAGRGSLRGWVRSIALRTAMKHARANRRLAPMDEQDFLELAASADDPGFEPYKQRYRDTFRAAFRSAVDALGVRHRNLLRQYFLDHMSIDELAALYRVHRATAARWIHDVRAELVTEVRRALAARLPADDLGLHTLIEMVASQLELSLERLAAPDED